MYSGEPSMARVCVSPPTPLLLIDLDTPKSSTFTFGCPPTVFERNRFCGLMSRWTMPIACASAIASQAWMTHSEAAAAVRVPCCSSTAPRSLPSRYSITM